MSRMFKDLREQEIFIITKDLPFSRIRYMKIPFIKAFNNESFNAIDEKNQFANIHPDTETQTVLPFSSLQPGDEFKFQAWERKWKKVEIFMSFNNELRNAISDDDNIKFIEDKNNVSFVKDGKLSQPQKDN